MTELTLVVKVTLVLLASLAATRLATRASASMRSLIMTSAFGVLFALPVASILLSAMTMSVTIPTAPMATMSAAAPHAPLAIPLTSWLRAAWLVGSLTLFLRIAHAMGRVRAMRTSAVPWLAGDALVADLARESGVSRSIDTLLRQDARAPLTIGLVRPAIVLPIEAPTWSDSDLRHALAHELEHIRRNDWAVHMLARAVCAIYWFNPLVWMAWRRLRLDSERACDDGVLRRADGAAYAEQLLLLARRLTTSAAVGLFMAHQTDLSKRIAAVLDPSQRRDRPGRASRMGTAAVAALAVLVIAPVQAVSPSATLTGHLIDPFGGAVENVKLYLEEIGGPESYQGRTDEAGRFAFSALRAGTYRLAAPMDFVPPTTIALSPGAAARRDIRMAVETLTDTFTVCAECPPEIDTYVPPDSLVAEFQRDRQDAWSQPVKGPEPSVGWESYWSRLPEYPPALKDAGLEGTVVVEGRIDTHGLPSNLTVVSAVHPALSSAAVKAVQAGRWEPGRVRGVPVEVPLRMTIDYVLHAPGR